MASVYAIKGREKQEQNGERRYN